MKLDTETPEDLCDYNMEDFKSFGMSCEDVWIRLSGD